MRTSFFPDGSPISPILTDDTLPSLPSLGPDYILTDYGIAADGKLHTAEIQALIDRIADHGGGVLHVPSGTYRTGALFLRPRVHLYLDRDAILLGSGDIADYPLVPTRIEGESCLYFSALINAEHCDGLCILGEGTIDGCGAGFWRAFWLRREWNPQCTNKDEQRPRLIYVSDSQHVTIAGVRLQNAAFWTTHLYRCRYVRILHCSYYSPYEPVKAPSTDAIDLDACCDVAIRGCWMHVNDDAVALKGGKGPWADTDPGNGPNERILIENCHYGFTHGCLTLGSEAIHCRNIVMRDITVDDAINLLWLKMRPDTPQHYEYLDISGIRGKVRNFLTILPWTQFFDLKGRKDIPLSYADHISLSACSIECETIYHVRRDDSQYRLSDLCFKDLDITADSVGDFECLQACARTDDLRVNSRAFPAAAGTGQVERNP